MNILDLIEGDGVKLTRHGATYRGRCPFHNGKTETSLLVDANGGKYHCFGCDMHGDAIQWLREKRGLSFIESCHYLGRDPGPLPDRAGRPAPAAWEPKEAKSPAGAWQEKARAFLDGAVACLWSARGDVTRAWLHKEKGLSDATIKTASLGYNPADIYDPRATWDLEPVIKEDGTEQRQWIPAGLVIPLIVNDAVHRLRIRRPQGEPRYVVVSGSDTRPMILGENKGAVLIVESELDGLLLNQDTGDLAGVVAMGSAQAKPDVITHELLTRARIIFVSLDTDDAGARASWRFWPETYGGKAKRWPCVKGKDPSAARLNGLDLRAWITTGIFTTEERFERFCIQTIDGGLTDAEALEAMGLTQRPNHETKKPVR